MSVEQTDVVVVGAGIIGSSCAFHLVSRGLRVTVVEAFGGPAEGSSGKSFGSIRGQWADPLNIELSWQSICAYRDFESRYGFDVGYRPSGYLFLVHESDWPAHLETVELQRHHGVPVEVLSTAAAQTITPFEPNGIGGATWGTADGAVDPHSVTVAYLSMARALGACVRFGRPVTAIESCGARWRLAAGADEIETTFVVNAAGGWSGEVAALAGLSVPVVHSRRSIYSSAAGAVAAALPMTLDTETRAYLRSEGSRVLFGMAKPVEVDGYDTNVDWDWMEFVVETMSQRFPWLASLPLDQKACWAGTYDLSPDHAAIIGADPAAPKWINACGFSGHGVMQAPEAGRLVAEEIVDGAAHSHDIATLRLERFANPNHINTALVF